MQVRYGRLTLLEAPRTVREKHLCVCDCGNEVRVTLESLRSGNTSSCGCLRKATASRLRKTHGLTSSPEYVAWQLMKDRCLNPRNPAFEYYGGRGIVVCDSWRNSFETFLAEMGEKPTPLHTLERKDGSKGYSIDNCVWATRKEQSRNRRNTKIIQYQGQSKPLGEWCELLGLDYPKTNKRLWRGWSPERAFTEK